jgi:hypothetical protein
LTATNGAVLAAAASIGQPAMTELVQQADVGTPISQSRT